MMEKENTDTIIEKLKNAPFENVVIHANGARFLLPVGPLKILAWNSVPDLIKDPNSEEARKNSLLRTGIKSLIRPLLPEILKKTWGKEVAIVPRLNILTWIPTYLIHLLINLAASKEWEIHVERCESCEGDVFKILAIAPRSNIVIRSDPPAASAAGADHQPVSRREELSASRSEDNHELRGPVGHPGYDGRRENNVRAGVAETTPE